jgi:serine phosphatase RsbU (regulator of sigma subunit)
MGSWQKHPLRFKYFFLTISIFFFLLIGENFFRIATTFDDQNTYVNPPSRLYLIKPLVKSNLKSHDINENILPPGAFLLSLDDKVLSTEIQVYRYLDEYDPEDEIKLNIFRLTPNDSTIGFRDSLFIKKRNIPDNFFQYLHSCVVVLDVVEGGVSDKAGLKTGDLIIKVNDKFFKSGEEAHRMVANNDNGRSVIYTVLRDAVTKIIEVELVKFRMPVMYLVNFIIGLIIMITGFWIGFLRANFYTGRLIGIGLLLLGQSLLMLSYGQFTIVLNEFIGILNITLARIALLLSIPILMHSLVYFPFERKGLKEKFAFIRVPYFLGAFSIISALIELSIDLNNLSGIIILITLIFYSIYYPIIFLFVKQKGKKYGGKTILASYLLFFIYVFLQLVSSIFNFSIPSYLAIIYLLIPLSYIFTIAKYSLFDEFIKLNKSIQFSILSASLNASAYLFILLSVIWFAWLEIPIPNIHFNGRSIEVLEHPLSQNSQEIYEKILLVIFAGSMILLLLNFKQRLLKKLNNYFEIVDVDYEQALNKLNEVIQKKLSFPDLAESISKKLVDVLKIKRAGVIFFDQDKKVLSQFYYGISGTDLDQYTISIENELVESIEEFSGNILIEYLKPSVNKVYLDCNFKNLIQIRAQSRLLGVLLIGEKKSEAKHNSDDLSFLSSISKQIAISVENVFLHKDLAEKERAKQELAIARRIQLSSLPQELPKVRGLEISAYSTPALEVGGDFYDFYEDLENEFLLTAVIGDVSGKGTSAALYMSKIQGIMKGLQEFKLSPQKLLIKSNNLIYNYLEKGAFITASCLQFNTLQKKIILSRAGHLPLYHYNSKQDIIQKHIPKGLVLGMNQNELFNRNLEELEIQYSSGDFFVLVTDGIIEARDNSQTDFQEERLLKVLEKSKGSSAEEIKESISKAVEKYTGREDQFDDITVMVLKAK